MRCLINPTPRLILLTIFACVGILYALTSFTDWKDFVAFTSNEFSSVVEHIIKPKIIVGRTTYFSGVMFRYNYTCSKPCIFYNPPLAPLKSAISVYHARDWNGTIIIPSDFENHLNVLFVMESPSNENLKNKSHPFDAVVNYRRDSTIQNMYDRFQPLKQGDEERNLKWTDSEINAAIARKSKLAVTFVSNCHSKSRRGQYIKALADLTNVYEFGKCANTNSTYLNETVFLETIDLSFFYLAFENSVCDDYLTEKFWNIKRLVVPVVLKRSIVEKLGINGSYFLAVDDYDSPAELHAAMQKISKNKKEYKRYLEWTKFYRKKNEVFDKDTWQCKICDMAHVPVNERTWKPIDNLLEWWYKNATCQKDYVLRFIKTDNT